MTTNKEEAPKTYWIIGFEAGLLMYAATADTAADAGQRAKDALAAGAQEVKVI